ncbi:MAG TPA: hypothetical protein VN174_00990 [Candidatus Methanoperedens sp.]|nr:hypothetical protein [Candidatus Methanoperedens sp.]
MTTVFIETTIKPSHLPVEDQPACTEPVIVPVITYRKSPQSNEEILTVKCKQTSCPLKCRYKNLVNLD